MEKAIETRKKRHCIAILTCSRSKAHDISTQFHVTVSDIRIYAVQKADKTGWHNVQREILYRNVLNGKIVCLYVSTDWQASRNNVHTNSGSLLSSHIVGWLTSCGSLKADCRRGEGRKRQAMLVHCSSSSTFHHLSVIDIECLALVRKRRQEKRFRSIFRWWSRGSYTQEAHIAFQRRQQPELIGLQVKWTYLDRLSLSWTPG